MFRKISGVMMRGVTVALLLAAYILGIGITRIFAFLAGRHFLLISPKNSSWMKRPPLSGTETMY